MATTTAAKTPNGARTAPPPSANGSTEILAPQDLRLVKYVRANIQPIVAAMLSMASRAGEERDWTAMNEYQVLAGQLSQLGGMGASVGAGGSFGAPAAMAASAGAH